MRQVLIRIPLDGPWSLGPLGEVPGFGFGVALLLWVLAGGLCLLIYRRQLKWGSGLMTALAAWVGLAVVIVMLPSWLQARWYESIDEATATLAANPDEPWEYYTSRGKTWVKVHQYANALDDYRRALELKGGYQTAIRQTAWLLATAPDESVRNGEEAVELAQQIAPTTEDLQTRKTEQLFEQYDTLAAAYAEAGRFDEAVAAEQRAARIAMQAGDQQRVEEARKRLRLYLAGEPYRDRTAGTSLPLYGYGFMMFLAFVAGGWTAARRAASIHLAADEKQKRRIERGEMPAGELAEIRQQSREMIWDMLLWMVLAGIAGARLFYCVQYYDRVFAGKSGFGLLAAFFNLREGGLVLYGGVVCAAATFLFLSVRKGRHPLLMIDIVVPSFFLGLAFGRLGCLMNGCCYGERCELPWAMSFPLGSVPDMALVLRGFLGAGDPFTLALHPSQLYSAINALALSVATAVYFRHRRQYGAVLAVGLLVYPVTRFLIEMLRGDELGQLGTPLTISQWVSIALFAFGLAYTFWLSRGAPGLERLMKAGRPAGATGGSARFS